MIALIFALAAGVTTSASAAAGPPQCLTKEADGASLCCIVRDSAEGCLETWTIIPNVHKDGGVTIHSPTCDPGWRPAIVSGQTWCVRELRAPRGE